MTNELKDIILKKQFISIIECMEYLFLAGYPISEAYDISCKLFNPNISLDISNKIYNEKESIILYAMDGCTIGINETYPTYMLYVKDGKVMFDQDLKNRHLWVRYNNLWEVLEKKHNMEYQEIQDMIYTILLKGIKLKDDNYKVTTYGELHKELEKNLKLNNNHVIFSDYEHRATENGDKIDFEKDIKLNYEIESSTMNADGLLKNIKLNGYEPKTPGTHDLDTLENNLKLNGYNVKHSLLNPFANSQQLEENLKLIAYKPVPRYNEDGIIRLKGNTLLKGYTPLAITPDNNILKK